jgi:5-formyltetrahydrofolate cyclo-ligase
MPGEPDVRSALERWHREGWDLALPQVRGRGTPLRFAAWAPGDPLAAGPLGTREPADALERIPDVLVIPCLGHDERGYRLGYGGGYYDRTLAAMGDAGRRVVAIGVAREGAAVRGFEPGPHERPLDWIVTPSRRIPGQARG